VRKWLPIACIAILLSVCVLGCKKNREIIHEEGLDQEFTVWNVLQVYQDEQVSFFHVEGTARWLGERKIKFLWGRTSTDLNIMTVDVGRIDFIIDEEKEKPTIMFVFDNLWLGKDATDSAAEKRSARILTDFPFTPSGAVYGITIRLSRQQYIDLMVSLLGKKENK